MDNFNASHLNEFKELLKLISTETVKASDLEKFRRHMRGYLIPFVEHPESLLHYDLAEKDKEIISFLGNVISRNF